MRKDDTRYTRNEKRKNDKKRRYTLHEERYTKKIYNLFIAIWGRGERELCNVRRETYVVSSAPCPVPRESCPVSRVSCNVCRVTCVL